MIVHFKDESAGSAEDYAKGELGIKYSYILELRPQTNSKEDWEYGFIMPEHYMNQIAPETYAGIKAVYYSLAK